MKALSNRVARSKLRNRNRFLAIEKGSLMAPPEWKRPEMAGRISEKIVSTEYEFVVCILRFEDRFFFLDEKNTNLLLPFLELPYSTGIERIAGKYGGRNSVGNWRHVFRCQ